MTQYRFIAKSQLEVSADSLEEAIRAFHATKERERMQGVHQVERIEVVDEAGNSEPVDRPLRAGDVDKQDRLLH